MKIDFWNDLQSVAFPCCDCNPQAFGVPTEMINQYKFGFGQAIGFTNPADDEETQANTIYLVRKTTYKDDSTIKPPKNPAGHVTTETQENPYDISISDAAGGKDVSIPKQVITQGGGDSFKGPAVITYEQPLTVADAKGTIVSKIIAAIDFEENPHERVSTNFASSLIGGVIYSSGFSVNVDHGRYQVRKTEPRFNDCTNYFKQEWATYFIPSEYEQYLRDFAQFEQDTKNHDNWLKCQEQTPGQCGAEPPLPEKPSLPAHGPIHMIDGEYEYDRGPNNTEWVEIPLNDIEETGGGSCTNENVTVLTYRHRSGNIPRLLSSRYIDPNNPIPQ